MKTIGTLMFKLLYYFGKRNFSGKRITADIDFMVENCNFSNSQFLLNRFDSMWFKNCSFKNCVFRDVVSEYVVFKSCCIENVEMYLCSFYNNDLDSDILDLYALNCMFVENKWTSRVEISTFRSSYFDSVDCKNAKLCSNNFTGSSLTNCEFSRNTLFDTKFSATTSFYNMTCPEVGSYIGWKCAGNYIIKLEITKNAKRSSATTRKCRASEAIVMMIQNVDGSKADVKSVSSDYDKDFVYTVGSTVSVPNFSDNRWDECAPGIHHFISREEAVAYMK